MKGLITKGAIGLFGAGGLGTAGYFAHQALNSQETPRKNDIETKLTEDGYQLLSENSTHFDAILESYKEIIKNKQEFKLSEFNGEKTATETAKDILLRECGLIGKNEFSEVNYKKSKKWCVEPISVTDILKKQKINALEVKQNDDANKQKWTSKIKQLKSASEGTLKISGITWAGGDVVIPEKDYTHIQGECKKIGEIVNHKNEFEDSLSKFKSWCTDGN